MEHRRAVGREPDIVLLQRDALLLPQHAGAALHRGQHAVGRAEQEQRAHRVAVVARHLGEVHAIERRGDRADAVLRQDQPQEPRKLLAVDGGVAQDLHELIQHAAEDRPQLRGLLRALGVAGLKQALRLLLQSFRQLHILQIPIERRDLLPRRIVAQPLIEPCERRADARAQGVDRGEPRLGHFVPRDAVTVGVRRPCNVPHPHLPADIPGEGVVLEQVALLRAESRKAGLEAAEHVLVLKPARGGVQRAEHQRRDRLLQNIAAAGAVKGNPITGKHRFHRGFVGAQVPRRERDVAEAIALLTREAQNLRRGVLRLGVGVRGFEDADAAALPLPDRALAEEVPLHMGKRAVDRGGLQILDLAGYALVLCLADKLLPHPHALAEQLAVALVAEQRHRDAARAAQQNAQDADLASRKVGKAV